MSKRNQPDGYTEVTVPALSLSFLGRTLDGAKPLGMAFTDAPDPSSLLVFDQAERGAMRALASSLLRALDVCDGTIPWDDALLPKQTAR